MLSDWVFAFGTNMIPPVAYLREAALAICTLLRGDCSYQHSADRFMIHKRVWYCCRVTVYC